MGCVSYQGTLSYNGLHKIFKGFYPIIMIIATSLTNS